MSLLKAILNYNLFNGESDRREGAYVLRGALNEENLYP